MDIRSPWKRIFPSSSFVLYKTSPHTPTNQGQTQSSCRATLLPLRYITRTMASLGPIFEASLRAVGTASTMAFAGFYLHRRGFVTPSGKKMMALLSQQVTVSDDDGNGVIFLTTVGALLAKHLVLTSNLMSNDLWYESPSPLFTLLHHHPTDTCLLICKDYILSK